MLDSHVLYGVGRLERLARLGHDGRTWYDRAQQEIVRICAQENWDVVEFTRILAILSPRVSIRRNVRMALAYAGQGEAFFTDTLPNVKRSLAIYTETGKIGGHKVPYFAEALLGNRDSVTLDSWMAIAMIPSDQPHLTVFRRKATMREAIRRITQCGKRLALTPRDCQAAIWTGIRREHGMGVEWFPVEQEYDRWLAYDRRFPLSGPIGEEFDNSF